LGLTSEKGYVYAANGSNEGAATCSSGMKIFQAKSTVSRVESWKRMRICLVISTLFLCRWIVSSLWVFGAFQVLFNFSINSLYVQKSWSRVQRLSKKRNGGEPTKDEIF